MTANLPNSLWITWVLACLVWSVVLLQPDRPALGAPQTTGPHPSDLNPPSLLPVPVPDLAGGAQVSPVIFPEQRLPLRFSHVQHLTLANPPSCETCHQQALTSQSSLDDLIPPEAACRACHAIDRQQPEKSLGQGVPPARCRACHPGYQVGQRVVARIYIPPPNIKFNHQVHMAQGMSCIQCHGDLAADNVALATRAQMPKMRLCLTCHDSTPAPLACLTCHIADAGGRVRTQYASGALMPAGNLRGAAHDLGFRTAHAAAAQNSADYCASCHQKPFCLDCHNSVAKPMDFHGGDYLRVHVVEARRNSPDCSACHRLQSFCTGCHARSGVSSDNRVSGFASGDTEIGFHPPGWSDSDVLGPDHHAFAARRNLRQCASCHREQFCVGCHSADPGGMGVNPHPPGWAGSRRCRSLLSRNPRVCLRCHVGLDEAQCAP